MGSLIAVTSPFYDDDRWTFNSLWFGKAFKITFEVLTITIATNYLRLRL